MEVAKGVFAVSAGTGSSAESAGETTSAAIGTDCWAIFVDSLRPADFLLVRTVSVGQFKGRGATSLAESAVLLLPVRLALGRLRLVSRVLTLAPCFPPFP